MSKFVIRDPTRQTIAWVTGTGPKGKGVILGDLPGALTFSTRDGAERTMRALNTYYAGVYRKLSAHQKEQTTVQHFIVEEAP